MNKNFQSFLSVNCENDNKINLNDVNKIILYKKDLPAEKIIKSFEIENSIQTLFSFKDSVLKNFIQNKINNALSSTSSIQNKNDKFLKELIFFTKKKLAEECCKRIRKIIHLDVKNNVSFNFSKKSQK